MVPFSRRKAQQQRTLVASPRRSSPSTGKRGRFLSMVLMAIVGYAALSFFTLKTHHPLDNHDKKPPSTAEQSVPKSQKKLKQPSQKITNEPPKSTVASVAELLKEPLPSNAKIHFLSSDKKVDQCNHTMVTGYFRLRSKYPAEQYLTWMANFLSVQDCMVIFTSSDMVETISNYRSHAMSRTVLIEMMSIDDLPIARLGTKFWEHQMDIDKEKKRHQSYQLFWIWLSKTWCVVQAIQRNFFSSQQIFMWQDIGSYRHKKYNGKTIMEHPEVIPPKTILWLAHHAPNPPSNPIWNDKFNEKAHYFHSGSQGAGEAEAWLEYHEKFAHTITLFLERDMFIGEDQCVLQSTCQQYPNLCAYLKSTQVKDNFYFGLRYALVTGGNYDPWRFPAIKEN